MVKLKEPGVGASLLGIRISTKKSPGLFGELGGETVKVKAVKGLIIVGVTVPLSEQDVPMMHPWSGSSIVCAEHVMPLTANSEATPSVKGFIFTSFWVDQQNVG
jgi:hypothetical protein